jgi:hypothetical protein
MSRANDDEWGETNTFPIFKYPVVNDVVSGNPTMTSKQWYALFRAELNELVTYGIPSIGTVVRLNDVEEAAMKVGE